MMILHGKSEVLRRRDPNLTAPEIMESGTPKKNPIDDTVRLILKCNYQQAFGLLQTVRLEFRTSPRNHWALYKPLSFHCFSRKNRTIWQRPDSEQKIGGGEQETLGVSGHLGNKLAGPRWAKNPLLDRMRARS